MDPENPHLQQRLEQLRNPVVPEATEETTTEGETAAEAEPPEPPPICGISK